MQTTGPPLTLAEDISPSNPLSDAPTPAAARPVADARPSSPAPPSSASRAPSYRRPAAARRPTFLTHTTDRLLLLYMLMVVVLTSIVLARNWDVPYSEKLREWLIVNAVFTVVRTVGRIGMHAYPRTRHVRVRKVLVWLFRLLTLTAIAWFIVGLVFLQREKNARGGAVYDLMSGLIAFELVVLGISILLGLIIFLFAPVLATRQHVPGATKEDLSKLRTFPFVNGEGLDESAQVCSICLCDYEKDDILRELPCATGNHVFHASCVDEWLTKRLSCPICRDDPLGRTKAAEQARREEERNIVTDEGSPV